VKRVKKILAGIIAATLITTILIGCGATENTVVTINNEKISEPLYRIYLWTTQQEFESLTPNIWDMELEGKKTEEVAKERTLDSIKVSIAAKQKAEELGVKLSKEEQDQVKEQAKQIMTSRAELAKELNFKQKDIEEFLSYGVIIEKVIQKTSENYVPNEEELKAEIESITGSYEKATVRHVLIGNKNEQGENLPQDKADAAKKLAEDILAKALKGEDMAELAKQYSEDPGSKDTGGEYTFGKGEMVPEFEEAAFTGEVGKVYPKLVETSYGYHIIKIENRTTGEAEQIKKDAEELIKKRFAGNELTDFAETIKVEKAEGYNDIHIIRNEETSTAAPETTGTENETASPQNETLSPENK
jgi:parvulin-like peptidyl-prolyl isomerase